MPKIIKLLLLYILASLQVACGEHKVVIATKQSHEAANKIVQLLLQDDVFVVQQSDKDGLVDILVNSNDLFRALQLLGNDGGIPQKYDTLGSIFKKDSFISSPIEEQARLEYALSQQISDMLTQVNGVVDVQVVISLPLLLNSNDWQPSQDNAITAAVYLRIKPESNLLMKKNTIKLLVSKAVSGLTPDNVAIFMEEAKAL